MARSAHILTAVTVTVLGVLASPSPVGADAEPVEPGISTSITIRHDCGAKGVVGVRAPESLGIDTDLGAGSYMGPVGVSEFTLDAFQDFVVEDSWTHPWTFRVSCFAEYWLASPGSPDECFLVTPGPSGDQSAYVIDSIERIDCSVCPANWVGGDFPSVCDRLTGGLPPAGSATSGLLAALALAVLAAGALLTRVARRAPWPYGSRATTSSGHGQGPWAISIDNR